MGRVVVWFHRKIWIATLVFLGASSGCGGADRQFAQSGGAGGGGGSGGAGGTATGGMKGDGGPDKTPPTIQGMAPADTAMGIPVVTMLSVDFSEPMAKSTVKLTAEQ